MEGASPVGSSDVALAPASLPARLRRAVRRAAGFAAAVVLSLGVGAGAAAAVAGLFGVPLAWPPRLTASVGAPDARWPRLGVPWRETAVGPATAQASALGVLLALVAALAAVATAVVAVNLGVLLTARAASRRHEMAVRAAIGAPRRRIVRQLLAEGAAAVGLGLAAAIPAVALGRHLLHATWPAALPRVDARGLPLPALLLGVPVALALGLSLLPAAAVWRRTNLRGALVTGGRATAGRLELAVRAALGVLMVAATVALLAAAGVLVRASTAASGAAASGFDAAGVQVARVQPPERGAALVARYEDALGKLRSHPGVEAAGLASAGAVLGLSPRDGVLEECRCAVGPMYVPYRLATVRFQAVTPGYFDTLRVRLLRGRDFTGADRAGAPPVAIIDRAFAEGYFDGDPVGRHILIGRRINAPAYTIVGIVETTRARALGAAADTTPALYLSALQHPPETADVVVRAADGSAHPARATTAALAAALPAAAGRPRPLAGMLTEAAEPLRWFGAIVGLLAIATASLAALGLASVMAFDTARRERELGVRMAIGATGARVVLLVVRRGARLAAVGAVLGVAAVYLATQLLRRLASDASALEPRALAALAVVAGAIAIAASAAPAVRAARVQPGEVLRGE